MDNKKNKEIENNIYMDRSMLGNEVAKLMSSIMNKEYIYLEDYIYEIANENEHINLVRHKIFTIINRHLAPHEPYAEYYDEEIIRTSIDNDNHYYYDSKLGYKNTYKSRIRNKDLFFLPFLKPRLLGFSLSEKEIEKYCNGKTIIDLNNSVINNYNSDTEGYNDIINDFLIAIFTKELRINRNLTQEEIEKIRISFIELYNNGDYEELNNSTDTKVIKKSIEK